MARPQNCGKCKKPKRPRGNKYKDLKGYCECGRPTVLTKEVLGKLEDAFANSFTDREACFYADISTDALYEYQKENPEFTDRKELLKLSPNLKAKETIVKALGDVQQAKWWVERKDPDFKPSSKVDHTVTPDAMDKVEDISEDEKAGLAIFNAARKKRIEEESKKLD